MPQNITTKIALLQSTKTRVAQLEQEIEAARAKELRTLPEKFGFESAAAFIAAVKKAAGRGGKLRQAVARSGRRQRHPITPAIREQVKVMVGQGATGAEMAKATGVSVASIANIKRELGLAKGRAVGKKVASGSSGEKKKS